jgi:hypothetical protein
MVILKVASILRRQKEYTIVICSITRKKKHLEASSLQNPPSPSFLAWILLSLSMVYQHVFPHGSLEIY